MVAATGSLVRDEVTDVLVRYATGIDSRDSRFCLHAVLLTPDRASVIHAYGWYDDEFVSARTAGGSGGGRSPL